MFTTLNIPRVERPATLLELAESEVACARQRVDLAKAELRNFQSEHTFLFRSADGQLHEMNTCTSAAESESVIRRHYALRAELDESIRQLNAALEQFCQAKRSAGLTRSMAEGRAKQQC